MIEVTWRDPLLGNQREPFKLEAAAVAFARELVESGNDSAHVWRRLRSGLEWITSIERDERGEVARPV